jgi:hypothetical protein
MIGIYIYADGLLLMGASVTQRPTGILDGRCGRVTSVTPTGGVGVGAQNEGLIEGMRAWLRGWEGDGVTGRFKKTQAVRQTAQTCRTSLIPLI